MAIRVYVYIVLARASASVYFGRSTKCVPYVSGVQLLQFFVLARRIAGVDPAQDQLSDGHVTSHLGYLFVC